MTSAGAVRALMRAGDWVAAERSLSGPPWPLNTILLAIVAVGPLVLAALALKEVTLLFWLVLVADVVLLFAIAVATFRTPALFIGVIILWFTSQRLVVALVAPEVSADVVRLLLTYKEGFYLILIASGAVTMFVRDRQGEGALPVLLAVDIVAAAFLGWLALVFIADPQSSSPELTYLRRFAAPVLLYLGGRLLISRSDQFTATARLLLVVAACVAAFGLVERFVFDIAFWRDTVDATAFYSKQVESGLLPQNWTVIYHGVPDGIFIAMPLGEPVRRLVSTYLEPTTLSSFLAFALLLLVFVPDLTWRRGGPRTRVLVALAAVALGVAIVATLSRGGMVTFLAGTGLILAARLLSSRPRQLTVPQPLLLLPLVGLIGFGAAITSFSNVPGKESLQDILATRAVSGLPDEPAPSAQAAPSGPAPPPATTSEPLQEIEVHPPGSTADAAEKHLRGLTTGLEEMFDRPLGRGLGATGNWSDTPGSVNESTVGVLAAQLGVIGLALYVGLFAAVIAGLLAAGWQTTAASSDLAFALAGALLGLFIVSCVSESASGLLGNAFYFLFAGWVLSLSSPAVRTPQFRLLPASRPEGEPSLDQPAPATHTSA